MASQTATHNCEYSPMALKSLIFILPSKFQRKRLEDMKSSVSRKGLHHTNVLSPEVTHIVSEFDTLDQVERQLAKTNEAVPTLASVVSTNWLIECLKVSAVVPVKDSQMLKKEVLRVNVPGSEESQINKDFPEWACQRGAKLNHLNLKLTSSIEILQEHAELRDSNQDYSRALAFRRASSVLKALPFSVEYGSQVKSFKDIGEHVKGVIMDILDHGFSEEVERISNSEWFKTMKLFSSVFGVGPATAKTWMDHGWKSIEDVQRNGCPSTDWRIVWGLAFLEDLNSSVSRDEANKFYRIVQSEAEQLLPGVIVTLVGGFRRGKPEGHDVDILLSHPTEGAETGLLPRLLSALWKRGLILIGHKERSTFRADVLFQDFKLSSRGQLDHFEKWLGICKFPKSFTNPMPCDGEESEEGGTSKHAQVHRQNVEENCVKEKKSNNKDTSNDEHVANLSFEESPNELYEPQMKKARSNVSSDEEPKRLAAAPRDWLARRVDLIIAPYSQYYYALVGWTGSKHFNRDARLYAQKKLGLKLTSHGLFDMQKHESLPATSEQQVFDNLKLPYLDPSNRNC